MRLVLGAAAAALLAGCPLPPKTPSGHGAADQAMHMVVAERGPSGGRLVVVTERGDRVGELTPPAETMVRDVSPTFSPDGRLIAFASSRDRSLEETSIWVIAAAPGANPVRLTSGAAIDLSPAWAADGQALVFASTRAGGIDLWQLPLAIDGTEVSAAGDPVQLTDLPGEELSPSIDEDGRIAFTLIDHEGGVTRGRIAVREPAGSIRELTTGPADSGPAWSPDGEQIAFTAPHLRSGDPPGVDGDLWTVPAAGGDATLLVDTPDTDESGPVWSVDGRWLFATSIYRSVSSGKALFSSVVYVDRWEKSGEVRMLVDEAGAVPRLSVAVAAVVLDASLLHDGPGYREELAGIIRRAYEESVPD